MERLNPDKLHVTYLAGTAPENPILPRHYTLTHSDRTGELFLSIGDKYETKQTSGLYTKLMRDEVLAEFAREEGSLVFRVHCHISGGFVLGTAKWRYKIFQYELRLVLEAIMYGDRTIFEQKPDLDNAPVLVHFQSTNRRFNNVENWGSMADYR